ncbi:hypothetical protein [Flavobacterium nitratireducens]|uniref:hypothetical protein n=1 Tax=Flavobacterium nitratireducens TaxID=992289 RepID=UPI0024156B44|nr:hypothetical protein [Flavobacterium nitratireducens]
MKSLKMILFAIVLFLTSEMNAQGVSLTFNRGVMGYLGNNQVLSVENLASINIARVSFRQPQSTGQFGGTQGNDLSGFLDIIMQDGVKYSIPGALNWRRTTGSIIEGFGFIFDPVVNLTLWNNGIPVYQIVGGSTINVSSTLLLQAYSSTQTFIDGNDYNGNAAQSGLLDALNLELANSPQPSSISLASTNVVEGNPLVYTVNLTPATSVGVPQYFTFTFNGTATNGSDYSSTYVFSNGVINNGDGTITVPGGVGSFTVTVNTIDDLIVESTETLVLNVGSKSATGNILDNDNPLAATQSQTNISCFGGSNGTASVTASGGTTPYTYSWKNSSNAVIGSASSITGLAEGSYTCTITDANSASITKNFTITQPAAALSLAVSSVTEASCSTPTGSVTAGAVSNAVGTVNYSWKKCF